MIWLMRVKMKSGRTKTFCFRLTTQNHHVWAGAKSRLRRNALVQSCSFSLL